MVMWLRWRAATHIPPCRAAIDAVSDTGKVTLLKDTNEDITIASGKTIELVLNAKLTNVSNHTIVVKAGASLTISGPGTVDNVTHQRAAIDNEIGGTVILNGGTYTAVPRRAKALRRGAQIRFTPFATTAP